MNRFPRVPLTVLLLPVLIGCGVKALPRLPVPEPAALTDLRAERDGEDIVLRWRLSEDGAVPAAFRIYRSQPPPCEGCPHPFRRIADAIPADAADGDGFRYVDELPSGMESVRYRLIPVGPGGGETGPGGLVEIDLRPEGAVSETGTP